MKKKRRRLLTILVILIIVVAVIAAISHIFNTTNIDASLVKKEIIQAESQFVAANYVFEKDVIVDDYKKFGFIKMPASRDLYRIKYEGVVKVGYNLKKANLKVNNDKRVIYIKIPRLERISTEMKMSTYEYEDSILNDSDKIKNQQSVEEKCKKDVGKSALTNKDIVQTARKSVKDTLTALLTSNGDTKDYTVKITYTEG